jgi:hypothetical protein
MRVTRSLPVAVCSPAADRSTEPRTDRPWTGTGHASPDCPAMEQGDRMTDVRKLDLNLVVVLDALLEERNLTRAAGRVGMTQPAVSAAWLVQRLRAASSSGPRTSSARAAMGAPQR